MKKNNGFRKYIDSLSPKEREEYVKSLSDRLMEYQRITDKHRDYLESLPTKELRIKESQRIRNEYFKTRQNH